MKIEPMSVEEIKEFIAYYDVVSEAKDHLWSRRMGRMLLTWAHAEARAREYAHAHRIHDGTRLLPNNGVQTGFFPCPDCNKRNLTDWLAGVLREIGWEDDHI